MTNTLSALGAVLIIFLFIWMNARQMARVDDADLERFWRMPARRVRRIAGIGRLVLVGIALFIITATAIDVLG